MASKCKATKPNGQPCEAWALVGSEFCYTHDPARARERAAARKLGGLNRRASHSGDYQGPQQVRSLAEVLQVLDYVLAEALALDNGVTRGRLLVAICAEFSNAIKAGEIENRLKALEDILNNKKGTVDDGTETEN